MGTIILSVVWLVSAPQRIGIVGDTQAEYRVARWVVRDMASRGLDRAIHLGDYAGCRSVRRWRFTRQILRGFHGPWYHTIGNHEIMTCGGRANRWTTGTWVKFWQPGIGRTYYQYRVGTWRFLHLDTAWPVVGKAQLTWLSRALSRQGNYLVLMHRPPPHPRIKRSSWDAMPPWGRNRRLWRLLYRHRDKIRAIFHGHRHAWVAYKLDGIQVYCTGGGGGYPDNRAQRYHYLVVTLWAWGGYHVERIMYPGRNP